MLQSYFPIYKISVDLQRLRRTAEVYKGARGKWMTAMPRAFRLSLKLSGVGVWLLVDRSQ
jgi:hypothetical protein